MKKMLSMILALAMILSLGVTAFAEELDTTEHSNNLTGSVTATYTAGTETSWGGTIYNVQINWTPAGSIAYTGAKGATYTWDATNTKYVPAENGAAVDADWTVTNSSLTVTVINKSNAPVNVSLAEVASSGLTVTGSWDNASGIVVSAAPENPSAENLEGEEKSATFTYTITDVEGTPNAPAEGETTVTVTTITVTLSK